MPVCGPVAGCPAPLLLAPPPVARKRCPPVRSDRLPDLRLRVGPWSGCPVPGPGAVHADPVARADAGGARIERVLRSSWGAPSVFDPLPRRPWPPASRWLGASKRSPRCSPLPVARSLVASELVASRPVRSRSRLVDRERFPPPATRRPPSKDSVSRPRLACAPRYEAYIRGRKTPGQEVFSKDTGLSTTNFAQIPRISLRSSTARHTGLSPAHGLFIPSSRIGRPRNGSPDRALTLTNRRPAG